MKSTRFVALVVFFLSVLLVPSLSWQQNGVPAPSGTGQDLPGLPDLNLLRLRVEEFWRLLQQGHKQEALRFVDPSSQENFLDRQEPQFMSFRLRDWHFEEDKASVLVTVTALRVFPEFSTPVEFPVQERYLFRDGTWYVQVAASNNTNPFASAVPTEAPERDPASIAKTQQELGKFEIKPDRLDLGELAQANSVTREISYRNGSSIPVLVKILDLPPGFGFDRLWFNLDPGKAGANKLYIDTQLMDGRITGEISIVLTSDQVDAKRVLKVEGSVKAPISFAPYPLILNGKIPQTITVKNNTSQAIRINDVNLPGKFLAVEWRSESDRLLPAGGRTTFTVRCEADKIPKDWPGGAIDLQFDRAVDGRVGTTLPVRVK